MLVVLDSNVFCADFQMDGIAWNIFLSESRRVGLEPCVPEIVRDEVLNKFREELKDISEDVEKAVRPASRMVGRNIINPVPSEEEIQRLCSEYPIRINDVALRHGFIFLPYPQVSHKELVERELAGLKPFRKRQKGQKSQKGQGYRDALLWHSVLEHLKEHGEPIAFVTDNSNDFGKGGLHVDLVRDLKAIGLTHGHVKFFNSLEELNVALIIPTLQKIDQFRQVFETEASPFSVQDWVIKELPDLLWDDPGIGPFEPGHGRSRLSSVKEIRSVKIDAVRQVAVDQIMISATADIEAMVDVSADWDDYQNYPDVREFFQSDDEPFSSVSADVPTQITVAFTLILRSQDFSVISSEVDSYQTDFGISVEINPHASDT